MNKVKNKVILSIAGENIDNTIINVEEMKMYVQERKRNAIVVTEKKAYGELDKMIYQLVGNYIKPKPRCVVTKSKPFYDVYSFLLDRYKGGLLIAESDTISEPIVGLLCNSPKVKENDIDVMICQNGYNNVSDLEFKKADYLRIHADLDIMSNIEGFVARLQQLYNEKFISILLSQLFVNLQYEEVTHYLNEKNEKYASEGYTDFIDYYESNKQLSYFVYFDIHNNKILNLGKNDIISLIDRIREVNENLVIPAEQVKLIAGLITNY